MSIKLKLIDVLDIIESGEVKEGTRVIWDGNEYIYDGRNSLWRESEYSDTEGRDIFEDICLGNLREEAELIEPKKECEHEWKFSGVRDIIDPTQVIAYEYCEKCGMEKVIETAKQKKQKSRTIEGYDIDGYEIEEIDIRDTYLQEGILKLTDKLNEVINKVNAQTTVLLSQKREIKDIKEQLDY